MPARPCWPWWTLTRSIKYVVQQQRLGNHLLGQKRAAIKQPQQATTCRRLLFQQGQIRSPARHRLDRSMDIDTGRQHLPISGSIPGVEGRQCGRISAGQRRPDQPVALDHRKYRQLKACGGGDLRMGGDLPTAPVSGITQPVVGTDDQAVLDPAFGQGHATVRAQIDLTEGADSLHMPRTGP